MSEEKLTHKEILVFEGKYTTSVLIDLFISVLDELNAGNGKEIRQVLQKSMKEYDDKKEAEIKKEGSGEGTDMIMDVIFNIAGKYKDKKIEDVPEEAFQNPIIGPAIKKAIEGATRDEVKELLKATVESEKTKIKEE